MACRHGSPASTRQTESGALAGIAELDLARRADVPAADLHQCRRVVGTQDRSFRQVIGSFGALRDQAALAISPTGSSSSRCPSG